MKWFDLWSNKSEGLHRVRRIVKVLGKRKGKFKLPQYLIIILTHCNENPKFYHIISMAM